MTFYFKLQIKSVKFEQNKNCGWRKNNRLDHKKGVTEFLVKDNKDFCCVKRLIPEKPISEIKEGDSIWWQSDKLVLNIFNVQVEFKKIGNSGGGVKEFYKRYLKKWK